jgi:tetratricopeptide (TPR) repeat protein
MSSEQVRLVGMNTSFSASCSVPPPGNLAPKRRRRWHLAGLGLAALGIGFGISFAYPLVVSAHQERLARRALLQQDLANARIHLQRGLAARPRCASSHFLLAQTLRRAGDFDGAREQLEAAGALGWKEGEIQLEELLLQAQSGVVQPVEGTLQLYLADGTGDPQLILEALVSGCLQCQLVDRAYHYSSLWTKRFPDSWHARFWHGRALEQGLRHDLAAEAYAQVLDQEPDHLEAHFRRGQVLYWRGRYPESFSHFQTYLRHRPDDPAALLALARCQHSLRPAAEVRETLDRLFALPGEHAEGWLLRGKLDLEADRPGEALPWLEKAVQRIPNDRGVNLALATALTQLRRPEDAKRYEQRQREIEHDLRRMDELTKEILAKPRDVALRHEAGVTLTRLGEDSRAIRWFVSALLLYPRHEPTRQALADCIRRLGDPKLTDAYRALLASPPERKEQAP